MCPADWNHVVVNLLGPHGSAGHCPNGALSGEQERGSYSQGLLQSACDGQDSLGDFQVATGIVLLLYQTLIPGFHLDS